MYNKPLCNNFFLCKAKTAAAQMGRKQVALQNIPKHKKNPSLLACKMNFFSIEI